MSEQRLVCPECGTGLRLKRTFGPREMVDCPRCDARFAARSAEGYRSASESESNKARASKARPVRPRRDEEDDEDDRPRRKKKGTQPAGNSTGLFVGIGLGGVALVGITAAVVWLAVGRGPAPDVQQASNTPPAQNPPVPLPPVQNPPTPNPTVPVNNPLPNPPVVQPPVIQPPVTQPPITLPSGPTAGPSTTSGAMDRTTLEKVKKATVYIRVYRKDGLSSGSGFLEEGSKMVMTNAHVLGMLSPSSPPPNKIELIFNSGLPDEKLVTGSVVGVDRQSDLAIVRMVNPSSIGLLPTPLKVVTAKGLFETQSVYVFGFPFGEKVGKNITVSQSSISSLRTTPQGDVEKVQVNGGMSPGNSGGPVVDDKGNVVGVAVSIITATQLNFAIPGEAVHSLLKGRISGIALGDPIRKGSEIAVPVTVEMINPLAQISAVEVEWWFAPSGRNYGPGHLLTVQEKQTGKTVLAAPTPAGNQATVELLLPTLPPQGHSLFVRPIATSGGLKKHVAAISTVIASPPEAKPSSVIVRFQPRNSKVKMKSTFTMRLNLDDEKAGDLLVNVESTLNESVGAQGLNGLLRYTVPVGGFAVGISLNGKGPPPSERFQRAIRQMGALSLNMQMNLQNNITSTKVDVARAQPDAQDPLEAMGSQMLQSLELATIPMPFNGKFNPGQTWSGQRKVSLAAMDMLDLLDKQTGVLDIVYTYKGVRQVGSREVPIIGLRGQLRGLQGGESLRLGGTVVGEVELDPDTGASTNAQVTLQVTTELKVRGGGTLQNTGKLEVKISR